MYLLRTLNLQCKFPQRVQKRVIKLCVSIHSVKGTAYKYSCILHDIIFALVNCKLYTILLTKTAAAQNEVALSYHKVRGLYFLAVVFAATIYSVYTVHL